MSGAESFFAASAAIMQRLQQTQLPALRQAAAVITDSIAGGGLLYTFGTGHSYYLAAEPFARAGGLWPVQVVACSNLSMLDGSARSGRTERLEGYAACLLADYDLRPGDVMLVISNSGRNAAPIEAALYARERGLRVIALTNCTHSLAEPPRHPSGQRLLDVADVVLDNCGVHGDASVELEGLDLKVGPTSTIMGATLIHALMTEVVANLLARGIEPPVLISGNVEVPDRERRYARLATYGRALRHR